MMSLKCAGIIIKKKFYFSKYVGRILTCWVLELYVYGVLNSTYLSVHRVDIAAGFQRAIRYPIHKKLRT